MMASDKNGAPYESVCVVVEGEIARDPESRSQIGFAAQYDGLFSVTAIHGLCNETIIVTQGDLQHHRWLFTSLDGEVTDNLRLNGVTPEIEIAENMTISGNS